MFKTLLASYLLICLLKTLSCQGSPGFLLYTRAMTWVWGWGWSNNIYKTVINNRGLLAGQTTLIKTTDSLSESVTYDPVTERLYWDDTSFFGNRKIFSAFLNGSNEQTVVTNVRKVIDLALDEAGRNLYWVDSSRGRIEVARLDGSFRKLLIRVIAPTAMVLDLKAREMYWSSFKNWQMKIEKASMDGSNRTVILSSPSRNKPTGLCIDVDKRFLYWVERRKQEIYYINLSSPNNVHTITTTSYQPFRLANIGQRIYWTDRGAHWVRNGEIGSLNTTSRSDIKILMNNIRWSWLKEIYAYDPNRPHYGNTKCGINKGGCDHLCLQSPQQDKCVCTDGMVLKDDGKKCHFKEFLLAADDHYKRIFYKSLDDLSHPRKALPLGRTGYINTVDYDPLDHKVYWTNNKGIISRAFLNGSSIQKVINSHNIDPIGHAIDVIGRNLYWFDDTYHEIGVSKLDGRYPKVLVNLSKKPVAMALDSKNGYIYWAHVYSHYLSIKRSQMNGTNQQNVINKWKSATHYIVDVSLAFDSDTNRLYFHDGHKISYTDTNQINGVVNVLSLPLWVIPNGLAVKESYIYWGDWHDNAVYRVNKTSLTNIKKVVSVVNPKDLHVYHNYSDTPDDFHPCAQNNGWCTHLCLINPSGYSCVCPTNTGSKKCYTTPILPSVTQSPLLPPSTSVVVIPSSSQISSSSAAQRVTSVQVIPSSSVNPSSSLNPVIFSSHVVATSPPHMFSSEYPASSAPLFPSSPPISTSTQHQSSSFQIVPSSSSYHSSLSSVHPSSPMYGASSSQFIASYTSSSLSLQPPSSEQTITRSSLHPISTPYRLSSSEVAPLSSSETFSSLYAVTSSAAATRSPVAHSSSAMFLSQVSSATSMVLSSSVLVSVSPLHSSTSARLSRAHPSSSVMVSPTPSLVLPSHSLQSSSLSSSSLLSSSYTHSLKPTKSSSQLPPPLSSSTTRTSSSLSSSSTRTSSSSLRPSPSPSLSVSSSVRSTLATSTTQTNPSSPSSSTPRPTCPPLYFGYDCRIYIGDNKMALTINRNGKRLYEKAFKLSVARGITEICKNNTCAELLRTSTKNKRDAENAVEFGISDVLVLSNPEIFSTESEILRIEIAIMNPLGQDSSVVSKSTLCKLVSEAKDLIEDSLEGPKITKLNPYCESLGGVPPKSGKQKDGGTPASVTISLSVLFVIVLLLVVVFFATRYIRRKSLFGKRRTTQTRNEFSFRNIGYLQDDTVYDCSEPTFTTTTHESNQKDTHKNIERPEIGRATACIPTNGPSHQSDQLEIHDYERLEITAPHLPPEEVHGSARPFGYAQLNPNTMLNHDYEAINPRRNEVRGGVYDCDRGSGSRRENGYIETASIGNPIYGTATPSRSRDHAYDNNEITRNDPTHVDVRPKRSRNHAYDNNEITRNDPIHVDVRPNRSRNHSNTGDSFTSTDNPLYGTAAPSRSRNHAYENNEITRNDPTHVDVRPNRSRNHSNSGDSFTSTDNPLYGTAAPSRSRNHAYDNNEITGNDPTHVDVRPKRSRGNIHNNNKISTTTDPRDHRVYDHLQRFNRQPSNNRDAADYDHLRRDHARRNAARDRQEIDEPSSGRPVLHIEGPDEKEETVI